MADISTIPARLRRATAMTTQRRSEATMGILFALPAILGFLIFALGPMIAAMAISFTDWSLIRSPEWVGLDNYERLFTDPNIRTSLVATFKFGFLSVPVSLIAALMIAVLLNQKIKGQRFFLTLFYFPSILPMAAVLVTFLWVMQPDFGLLNYLLVQVGLPPQEWLGSADMVIPSLVLMSVWGAGGGAVIFLAALQGIPDSFYEAAEIDGAGSLAKFRHVTLPLVSPIIFFQLVLGVVGALQVFTQAYLLDGGAGDAALFFNFYLYQNAFEHGRMGFASAMAWLLFGITLILTLLVFRSSALWVFYEDQGS